MLKTVWIWNTHAYKRWPDWLLTWLSEVRKEKEKTGNEVIKGSGICDEVEESNSWRRNKRAKTVKSEWESVIDIMGIQDQFIQKIRINRSFYQVTVHPKWIYISFVVKTKIYSKNNSKYESHVSYNVCRMFYIIIVTLITSAFGGLRTTIWGTLSYTSKFQNSQFQISI